MDALEKAKIKREAVLGLIPPEWQIQPPAEGTVDVSGPYIRQYLSEREIEITETDATGIVKHTTTGSWTAEEVTRAFCHRAALAHQLVNCLHEIFFEAAIEDAKALDAYFAQHRKPTGLLHGLPVSLKDQFHVMDVDTHMGYIGWIGTFEGDPDSPKARVFESELVRELRALGAVLYCKTAVPSTLMCGETANNIVGYVQNPQNLRLSSGGSSGGEGALIALKGSPLGVGTDIGGSVRIPSAFNGLYGLKPSSGRLPYIGVANSMDGQNTVYSSIGPLSSSVGSLRLLMTSVLSQEPWLQDPTCHELPWRPNVEAETAQQLAAGEGCFGMFAEERGVTPHPPMRRGLDIVRRTLEGLGHKVLDWDVSAHSEGDRILGKAFTYDGGADARHQFGLGGETPHPIIDLLVGNGEQANAIEIAANNAAKREWQRAYLERWMATQEVSGTGRPMDAVITFIAPFAAAVPGNYAFYGYAGWANVLDYSSCVIPVTKVDKMVDKVDEGFQPKSRSARRVMDLYDPNLFDGTPVAVQVVCRRLQEEKCLAIAEYVANALSQARRDAAKL